jgi:hypothetical protein
MEPKSIDISDPGLDPVPISSQNLLRLFPIIEHGITYDEFFRNHLLKNLPCLIKSDDLNKSWPSFNDWVNQDGSCNLNFFRKLLPSSHKVPVSDCDVKYFNSQEKVEMTLEDYLTYWENRSRENVKKCLYLKDWHFRRDCPNYTGSS